MPTESLDRPKSSDFFETRIVVTANPCRYDLSDPTSQENNLHRLGEALGNPLEGEL